MIRNLTFIVLFLSISMSGLAARRYTVAQDGSGDFRSIQSALDALPSDWTGGAELFVKRGVYREKVFVRHPHVTLVGEDRAGTQIVYPILYEAWEVEFRRLNPESKEDVRWGCATLNLHADADDFSLVNLTVSNNYGSTATVKTRAHQFTVFGRATRTIILNCDLFSDGADNVSLWSRKEGMYYHADCRFRAPGVDYVCPRGWCYIENSIFEGASPAQIWHDGSRFVEEKFVLRNCRFEASEPSWLGRFHRDSQFYLLDCSFSSSIKDQPIGYAYRNQPMALKWGERIFYHNCHRDGDVPFAWMHNNLHEAAGSPEPKSITPRWTFDGRWDPTERVDSLRQLYPYSPFNLQTEYIRQVRNYPFIRPGVCPDGADTLCFSTHSYALHASCRADLFLPKLINRRVPVVILIHGGGWESGNRLLDRPLAYALSRKGFAALCIDYRKTGEALYPAAVEDVEEAVRWVRSNARRFGWSDRDIRLLGSSAGGQLASLVGARNRVGVSEVICIDGVQAFIHPLSAEGTRGKNESSAAIRWLGATPEDDPERWRAASPLYNLSARSASFRFYLSGQPRFSAGYEESVDLLRKLGKRTFVKRFDGTPHTFWLFEPWFGQLIETLSIARMD